MSLFSSLYSAPARALKSLTSIGFSRAPSQTWRIARSVIDFNNEVGDGTGSSTVMAPLLWVLRTFPEAPPALWKKDLETGLDAPVIDHPILRTMQKPNDHYSGMTLWMSTLLDYQTDGNAYWLLLNDDVGVPREYWWAPAATMTPCGTPDVFISHYEYRPGGGEPTLVRPKDVVHFRFGQDPDDPRRGFSPLKSVIREVFTDDEAARFTASLLRNYAIPGVIVSPQQGAGAPRPQDVDATKAYISDQFTGEHRGEPLVLAGPTKVEQFGFSPEQLTLKELRRIPEERVSAVLGVPAIVAGLGAGLDRSTFTNMAEAREMAYESNIIPTQRLLGEDLKYQLLSRYESDPFPFRVGFDLTKVRVLQDDVDRLMTRNAVGVNASIVKRSEARRAVGLPVDAGDDVYLIPQNIAVVPADPNQPHRTFTPTSTPAVPAPADSAALALAAANGNGGHLND